MIRLTEWAATDRPRTSPASDIRHHPRVTDGVSDREQRRYALMQQRIDGFREGRLSIGPVIADLENLVNALEETPQE
jgi:hypothetical protein